MRLMGFISVAQNQIYATNIWIIIFTCISLSTKPGMVHCSQVYQNEGELCLFLAVIDWSTARYCHGSFQNFISVFETVIRCYGVRIF